MRLDQPLGLAANGRRLFVEIPFVRGGPSQPTALNLLELPVVMDRIAILTG